MKDFLRRRRAMILLGTLLVVAGWVTQQVAERNEQVLTGLSSRDSGKGGALGLATWLTGSGYQVGHDDESQAIGDIYFVLQPSRSFDRSEARAVLDWVRNGGVLLYLPGFNQALATQVQGSPDVVTEEMELRVGLGPLVESAVPSPLFFTAPPAASFRVNTPIALTPSADAWTPIVESAGGETIIAALRPLGAGWVYAASAGALLSNDGIGSAGNAAFVQNLLARHAPHRTVTFDERHHALLSPPGLFGVMRERPWGWAVAYAAIATFLFVLWGGRRFGPPVVPERPPLRSPGEYVVAFAGLLQRGRAIGWGQEQYRGLFRRRLARRLGVSPAMGPNALARLYAERHGFDPEPLVADLAVLEGPAVGERQLLETVRSLGSAMSRRP